MFGMPVVKVVGVFGDVVALVGFVYGVDALPGLRRHLNRWLGFVVYGAAAAAVAAAIIIAAFAMVVLGPLMFAGRLDPSARTASGIASIIFDVLLAGIVVGMGMAIGGYLESHRPTSRRRNRILIVTAAALVVASMLMLALTHFSPRWSGLITTATMGGAFAVGVLLDVRSTGPRYLRWFFILVSCYLLVIVVPMVFALAFPSIYGQDSPVYAFVTHGVSVFTVTMIGIVTPGLFGYVLANRSAWSAPEVVVRPPSLGRFFRRWAAGLAVGLFLPLLAAITRLNSLMFAGALIGFFLVAAQGEGRRLLMVPRVPTSYDPAARRIRPRPDRDIARTRFRRGLTVLGGYVVLVEVLNGYVSLFPGIQGPSDEAVYGWPGAIAGDLVFLPVGAAIAIGVPAGAFYAWGPYVADRIQRMSATAFAKLGVVMTVLGAVIQIAVLVAT